MSKLKLFLFVTVILSIVFIIIAPACQTSTSPAPIPAETKPQVPQKIYTLNCASVLAETGTTSKGMIAFFKEVEKRTNGQVKIGQYTWSGSLLKTANFLEGVRDRAVDCGFISILYWPTKMPLTYALQPVFLDDASGMSLVIDELWNKVPELKEEWLKWNIVPVAWFNGSEWPFMTNFPVNKLEDLQGKKMRALSVNLTAMRNCGAVPVAVAAADVYDSMSKGSLDGVVGFPAYGYVSQKMAEVSKYNTDWRYSGSAMWFGIGFNKAAWDEIPPNLQKIILECAPIASQVEAKATEEDGFAGLDQCKKLGQNISVLSVSESQRIQKAINPQSIWEDGLKAAEAAGYKNVRAYMDIAVKIVQDYDAKHPHPPFFQRWMDSRGIK